MRWRLMLSVLLGMAVGSGREPTAAQDGNTAPPHNSANQTDSQATGLGELFDETTHMEPVSSALLLTSQVAKFRMILGRLSLDPPAHIKCERSAKLACGGSERVEVTAVRGIPSLHYYFETANRKLTVDVSDAEHVRIISEVNNDLYREKLRIDQPSQGMIKLSLVTEDRSTKESSKQDLQVPSFVHLRASHTGLYQRHLAPTFARLLERPQITCSAADLVRALDSARSDVATPEDSKLHSLVDRLVDSLRSPTRETRNRAERELRALGLPALCFIDAKLQHPAALSDLDVEQRMRLQRVRSAIVPSVNDSPRQLARWLASDIRYWNMVAGDLPLAQLQSVQSDVISVTGQTIRPEFRVAGARPGR